MSYTALPLPALQILKGLAPLATLLISWTVSFTNPKLSTLGTMVGIAVGVCIATHNELGYGGMRVWMCVLGTMAECARLLVVERLLKEPSRGRFPGGGSPVKLDEEDDPGAGMSPFLALYFSRQSVRS